MYNVRFLISLSLSMHLFMFLEMSSADLLGYDRSMHRQLVVWVECLYMCIDDENVYPICGPFTLLVVASL